MKLKSNNAASAEILSLWRNLQIEVLEGRKFPINEKSYKEFVKSDKYTAYTEFTPGEIITGSNALKIFGLLDRDTIDLDVVITDPLKYGKLGKAMYSNETLENYIGTKRFTMKHWFKSNKEFHFDFFQFNDTQFIELDIFKSTSGLKVELPLNIIRRKIELADSFGMKYGEKHLTDVMEILTGEKYVSFYTE